MTQQLSPAARSIFESFNRKFDWIEDGVPGTQFKAIASALRAAADQVAPHSKVVPQQDLESRREAMVWGMVNQTQVIRQQLLAIAAELETQ